MGINITFTDVEASEVQKLLKVFDGESTNEKIDKKIKEEKTKKKRGRPAKKTEPEISSDDVLEALKQFAEQTSKKKAKEVLNEFASKVSKLKEEDYPKLMARLVEEMETDEDEDF